jgi:hypothetical protein
MSREMGLPHIVLTSFAGAYQLNDIEDRGWPIEALSERVSDKGLRHHMVTASPQVYISKWIPAFLGCDTVL